MPMNATMSDHHTHPAPADTHEPEPETREEYGTSGIEYTVLMRRPDGPWDLYDGQVYADADQAQAALAAAAEDLTTRSARLWEVLKRTPDATFMDVAADYERSKGAQAALFARAVSSFVAL